MPIVEIENLSKKYVIAHEQQNPYASLKETLSNYAKSAWLKMCGRPSTNPTPVSEEFWALRDINLTIEEGDRLAILGRNGAGKSTFLKLISRITEPTNGRIKIRGRVSSLLEVGTGFHPDLTGRENILFNGAILGMSYHEMKRKFDEIVAFADVEKFLDTPIKRYSSGMFMRLGFAIAAHLDADLLIVDEVLAVGDAQFQEKCLKKLNEISSRGCTILFVSHSVNTVLSLCNKGILLEKGELKAYEPIDECVSRYVRSCPVAGLEWQGNAGNEYIRLYQALLTPPMDQNGFFYQDEKTSLKIKYEILKPHPHLILGFSVFNSRNQQIARSRLCDGEEGCLLATNSGLQQVSFQLDLNLFHPGEYQIKLDCSLPHQAKMIQDDILLKFAVYSRRAEIGTEKDGISLGNRWQASLRS